MSVVVRLYVTALFTFIDKFLTCAYLLVQMTPSVVHMVYAVQSGDWTMTCCRLSLITLRLQDVLEPVLYIFKPEGSSACFVSCARKSSSVVTSLWYSLHFETAVLNLRASAMGLCARCSLNKANIHPYCPPVEHISFCGM